MKNDWKDRLIQIGFTIVCFALAGIPTYFFLFIKSILNPEGFWQKFLVYGLGIWFVGGLQFILLIIAIFLVFKLWTDF
jgi:uncharacterized membrane protein